MHKNRANYITTMSRLCSPPNPVTCDLKKKNPNGVVADWGEKIND